VIAVSTTSWWVLGYALGAAVVVVAAALLVTVILFARRIVGQAAAITLALDGAMRNTTPLLDLAMVNHSIESLTRGLKKATGVQGETDERSLVQRIVGALGRRL
jgi:hypothetical protein